MKKMSEVFELPINHEYLEVYGPERAGIPYAEAEKHAAHAINHVDALADSLESMLEEVKCMAHSKWDANTEGASTFELSDELLEFNAAFSDEIAALAAYRGEK